MMNKKEKIIFLKDFSKGINSIANLKPDHAVIIYHENIFKVGKKIMNDDEVKEYTKGMKAVFYLPENFRD